MGKPTLNKSPVGALLNEKVRFVYVDRVSDIHEVERIAGGRKSADGSAELLTVSDGFVVRIGAFSFGVGPEPPPFKKGDYIRVTLEQTEQPTKQEVMP
jgi:hypothetical protein